MNADSPGGSSIRRVRTFADDMKRAQNASGASDTGVHTPEEEISEIQPPTQAHENEARDPKPTLEEKIEREPRLDSHLTDTDDVFDIRKAANEAQEGTIVTNTRRNRWSLSRAAKDAVSNWWEDVTDTKDTQPEDPVSPAAKRAETINKAGQKSHLAPRDDREVVVEKLRTLKRDTARATGQPLEERAKTLKDEPAEWAHLINQATGAGEKDVSRKQARGMLPPQAPVKTAAAAHTRADVIAKDADYAVAPETQQHTPDDAFAERFQKQDAAEISERRDDVIAKQPDGAVAPNVEHEASARARLENIAAKHTQEVPPQREAPPKIPTRDTAFTLPQFRRKEAASVRTYRTDAIEDIEDNKKSPARIASAEARRREKKAAPIQLTQKRSLFPVFATLAVVFVFVAGSTLLYMQLTPSTPAVTDDSPIPSFVTTTERVPVLLPESHEELLSILAQVMQNVSGPTESLVQIYPVTPGGDMPAPTSAILDVLDPRAPSAFLRTLREEMMLGTYVGTPRAPFMIFKVTQFDTAFAGMLEWESAISSDLAPLFGEPVRRTLDPTARTNDQTRTARFVDDSIRNHNVRILYNELGEERMLYAFIDRETLVITTNAEAFISIVTSRR